MRLLFVARAERWLRKAGAQLGFAFTPRRAVQTPGSRGGHGYYDQHGKFQYGDRPASTLPELAHEYADRIREAAKPPSAAPTYARGEQVLINQGTMMSSGGGTRSFGWERVTVDRIDGDKVHYTRAEEDPGGGKSGGFFTLGRSTQIRRGWDAPAPTPAPQPAPTSAPAVLARPTAAKTYAEDPKAQPYEVLESEYVDRQLGFAKARAVRQAESWAADLAKLKPGTKAYEKAKWQADWWASDAKKMAENDPERIELMRRNLKLQYLQLVKTAISKGKPVPLAVIGQSIEFRKAADARQRYEKGLRTSFGNTTSAVDNSMQAARGYKVKRQNGTKITPEQKAEIATGMDEIESAVGSLNGILERVDVTVSHSSGRHPFMSTAGGMYSPGERTITMGIRSSFSSRAIPSLAHELAHLIDFEAGRAAGLSVRVSGGYYSKRAPRVSSSVADADASHGHATGLLRAAAESMTDTRVVDATLKARLNATNDIGEKERIERTKTKLGLYFREPCELWARLFEQYVAHRRGGRRGVSHDDSKTYESTPGYWGAGTFAAMVPAIEAELARRLALLRPSTMQEGLVSRAG